MNVPWTLAGLRDAFENAQGPSLSRVFEDWFERAGAPEIEASMRTLPSEQRTTRVDVTLVQKRGAFRLPVEIVFVGAGREHRETVEIAEPETSRLRSALRAGARRGRSGREALPPEVTVGTSDFARAPVSDRVE